MPNLLAGQPAPRELLTNIPRLVSAYYTGHPDPEESAQQVSFGTSGHRGSSTQGSFNEDHILAVCQALVEYRRQAGITLASFFTPVLSLIGSPSPEKVRAAIENGIVTKESFAGAFKTTVKRIVAVGKSWAEDTGPRD